MNADRKSPRQVSFASEKSQFIVIGGGGKLGRATFMPTDYDMDKILPTGSVLKLPLKTTEAATTTADELSRLDV